MSAYTGFLAALLLVTPPDPAPKARIPVMAEIRSSAGPAIVAPLLALIPFASPMMMTAAAPGVTPLTSTPYLFYKVDITAIDGGTQASCAEIELLDGAGVNLLRQTISSGTASASSTFGGAGISAALAFTHAFLDTGGSSVGWVTASGTAGWLKWTSSGTIDVTSYALTARTSEGNRAPKNFTLEYSDDDSAWTAADTRTNITGWASQETRAFSFASVGAHKYWRINVTAVDGGSFLGICSFRLVCSDGSVINNNGNVALIHANNFSSTGDLEQRLMDGSTSTGWTGTAGTTNALFIHLPIAVAAAQLNWTSRSAEGNRSPKDFTIKGASTFAGSLTTLKTVAGETGWGSLETRSFHG